jgi:hypothetical protein
VNKRRYLSTIDESKGDLWPFKRCVVNGECADVDAPAGRCLAINTVRFACYFCLDWLPGALLPPVDSDLWCQSVVRFLRKAKAYSARERRPAGRVA